MIHYVVILIFSLQNILLSNGCQSTSVSTHTTLTRQCYDYRYLEENDRSTTNNDCRYSNDKCLCVKVNNYSPNKVNESPGWRGAGYYR